MLNLFRNKLVVNLAWVIVFSIAIQAFWLFNLPQDITIVSNSPLLKYWLPQFSVAGSSLYISLAIVFIGTLLAGFAYNQIINNNEVLFRQSFFPVFFFFYLSHLFGVQNLLSPQFLASIFLLLVVFKFLSLDPRNIKTTPFLDMGFFMAAAFCILPNAILFLPALLLSLIIAGYLRIKNFLLLLTGLSIPIYFLWIGYYLAGQTDVYYTLFEFDFLLFDKERFTQLSLYDSIALGYVGLVLLISLANLQGNFSKNTIRTRRSQQMLLSFLVSGIACVIFSKMPIKQAFTMLALPLSPFLSYYFLKTKRPLWRETLFALFFIITIIVAVA